MNAYAPPPHIIYWNGNTYKSLQTLVARISAEEYYLFGGGRDSAPRLMGPMAVYFEARSVLDLAPIVMPVLERQKTLRPELSPSYGWGATAQEKADLKKWRTGLREELKQALEEGVPLPYKG